MKKKLLYFAVTVVLVSLIILIGAAFYMLDYALSNGDRNKTPGYAGVVASYPETRSWLDSLSRNNILKDTFVVMPGGERHRAVFARSDKACGHTAVVVHGYKDHSEGMLHIARIYNEDMGYNIILPDLHAHGQSDGDNIQMGWKDRQDVMNWIRVAERMFRQPGCRSRMVVHGISMGAATTMNVSGDHTPEYVRCFVEDCGYTSVWDEFRHEMKKRFGLPAFPLLNVSNVLCKIKYGWSFGEASPLKQVAKCRKPMLFIHGDNDDFVPSWMVRPCFEAKPYPKELWIAKGSAHAVAYRDHKQMYSEKVRTFVERWINR